MLFGIGLSMSPSIDDIEIFVAVAKSSSMRRAADQLGISPSIVSRQIAKLEDIFGKTLFERRPNGVKLTSVGQVFFDHAIRILHHMADLQTDIQLEAHEKAGIVNIASVEGVTKNFLAPELAAYRKENPHTAFNLRVLGRNLVLSAVEDYEAEIGLVYDHFSNPGIEIVGQWKQPLLAFVRSGHSLLSSHATVKDLEQWHYALPDDSFGIRRIASSVFQKRHLKLSPMLVTNQLQFLIQSAIESDLIIFMPLQAARQEVEQGLLVPMDTGFPEFQHRFISFVVHRSRPRASHVQAVLDHLIAAIPHAEEADRKLLDTVGIFKLYE